MGGRVVAAVAWTGMGQFDPGDPGVADHLGSSLKTCPDEFLNAEPISKVARSDAPLFVAHSVGDTGIAAWTDENLATSYLAPMTFYEPKGSEHRTDFFHDATATTKTLAFLSSYAH